MKGFSRPVAAAAAAAFLLWFLPHHFLCVAGDVGVAGHTAPSEDEQGPPSPSSLERLLQLFHAPSARLPLREKLLRFAESVQRCYFPPNLDFRRSGGGGDGGIEKAVKKSLGMGREAVEESAKTAAKAVQKTAGKVKESVGDGEEEEGPNPEL